MRTQHMSIQGKNSFQFGTIKIYLKMDYSRIFVYIQLINQQLQ